jgi:CRISPR/Cas system-associated protein Csm6
LRSGRLGCAVEEFSEETKKSHVDPFEVLARSRCSAALNSALRAAAKKEKENRVHRRTSAIGNHPDFFASDQGR